MPAAKMHDWPRTGTIRVKIARSDKALARAASGQERDLQNSVEGGTISTRRRTNLKNKHAHTRPRPEKHVQYEEK